MNVFCMKCGKPASDWRHSPEHPAVAKREEAHAFGGS